MSPEEFAMQVKKAETIRDKYSLSEYLRNPTEEHKILLEKNRAEIEQTFDIFAVAQTFNQGYKEGCEYLKQEGFFGKQ
jgi:N-acetylglutamate synthase-like GNAT family acetyltransferase